MPTPPQFGFALEYVQDIERARRFYIDVLGLKEQRYHETYVQFEHFAIASDASLSGTNAPELYWLVDDIEAAHDALPVAAGASPIRDLPFGRVFTVDDPEGRPRYLLEFAKNRPSAEV